MKTSRGWMVLRACMLIVAVIGANAGCIMYREGLLPQITQWPPDSKGNKPSISLVVSGKAKVNDDVREVMPILFEKWRGDVVLAYQESGLFSEVKPTAEDTDLRAEIRILDRGEYSFVMSFITGLTMFLIPSKTSDMMTVTTAVKDRNGTTLSSFEKSEGITTWMELFLVFAKRQSPQSIIYDLNRAIIVEAHSKGIL